jgi:N-acetyl-gamma-glutamylphosphate reductase
LLRLCATHPSFELAYVGGESTAGQALWQRVPALAGHPIGNLVIQPFVPEETGGIDLLFVSLPTGKSSEPLTPTMPIFTFAISVPHNFVPGA